MADGLRSVTSLPIFALKRARKCRQRCGNVLRPFPERGQRDGEHVQAVEQVLAEQTLFHLFLEIFRRSGDDPHIDPRGLGIAHRADLALLQHPQQLDLQEQGQLPYFVQE